LKKYSFGERKAKAGSRKRRDRAGGLLATLAVMLWFDAAVSVTRAQVFDTQSEGLPAGRFLLYPSLVLEYTDDGNVRYVGDDLGSRNVIASGLIVVRPRILVDLPLGESRIRWLYSALYRDYTTDRFKQSEKLSHFFDLEALLKSRRGFTIAFRDHFVRDSLELQQIDPGGELTFGLVPFYLNEPSLELSLAMGERQSVSLIPRYTSARFDDPTQAAFFNYHRRAVEGRYNYEVAPSSTLYGFYSFDATEQERQILTLGNVSVSSRTVGLGLTRTLNQIVVTSVSGGYETIDFKRTVGRNYAGPVLDARAAWTLNDVTRMEVTARRQAFQSFFLNNNFYLNSQLGVRVTRQTGRSVYWTLATSFQQNAYSDPVDSNSILDPTGLYQPSQRIRRKDGVLTLEAGAGFRILRTLRAFLGYNFERRQSNIIRHPATNEGLDPNDRINAFSYHLNRIVFRIEAGWS
jgi:hypothetical protein